MSATNLKLRCDEWDPIDITLTETKLAGAMDIIEDMVVVYMEGGDSGDKVSGIKRCPAIVLPKDTGSTVIFAKGDKIYFNNSTKKVTNVSSGNTLCGRANEDAAGSATELEVDFDGCHQS